MMLRRVSLLFALLAGAHVCDGYKILVVFPMPGKSHAILGDGYVRNLLKAGHQVTYLTPFVTENKHENLTQVDCSTESVTKSMNNILNIEKLMNKEIDMKDTRGMFKIMGDMIHGSFTSPQVQELMNNPNANFDLAIIEWLGMDTVAAFAAVFDVPFIWSSSLDPHWMILELIDEATNPAYTADLQSTNLPPFGFLERLQELSAQVMIGFFRKMLHYTETKFYEEVLGPIVAKRGRSLPPFESVLYNASMMLSNSHYSLGQPIRLPQNLIPIGGYHIDTNIKPLPKDLQKIMDESKNGVIYFSMGSNLKSKHMPDELKQSLLKMFGSLPYTVLWKFEESWDNLPTNVHILQWAPQPSILAHPNCVLFITHGGLLSTTETVHFGVPIIGIPVFGDQFVNVQRSVAKGYAKKVELSYDMADDLKAAILEMVSNPSYKEKVKHLSSLYHERPVKPADELVFWVEHVIKTRGAPHLRSPALHVPFYQKYYLDLAALVLAALISIRVLIKYLVKFVKHGEIDENKKNN